MLSSRCIQDALAEHSRMLWWSCYSYWFIDYISRRPSWIPRTQPNGVLCKASFRWVFDVQIVSPISPHYCSVGRRQGSRAVFGGCLTLSAYFAIRLYHKTQWILNIKPYSWECGKSGKSVCGFFRLCLKKKSCVFFEKRSSSFFKV